MKIILLAVLSSILAAPARAQFSPQVTAHPGSVPSGINYSGRLEQSGSPVTGSKQMVFRVYDATSGGNQLWAGAAQTVAVSLGLFNASVPVPISALVGGGSRYLEVEVDGTILSPRELLNSVPYAMVAKSVEGTFDISTAGLSIMPNPLSSTAALFISSTTGEVAVGGPVFTVGVASFVVAGGSATVGYRLQAGSFLTSSSATASAFFGDGSHLSGLSESSTYASSKTFTTAVGIAVQTESPAAVLDVNGDAQFGSGATKSTFTASGDLNVGGTSSLRAVSAVGNQSSCFLAGTLIATPSGQRPIETLRAGDDVLSYDVAADRKTVAKVLHAFQRRSDHYYVLDGRLRVTGEHPFWANGAWVKVKDLNPGVSLFNGDGPVALAGKRYVPGEVDVYNLEVDVTHTYFAEGILVHNKLPATAFSAGLDVTAGFPQVGRTYAIYASSYATGSSYAAYFGGFVGIGSKDPVANLDISGENAFINVGPTGAGQYFGIYFSGIANSGGIYTDDPSGITSAYSSGDIDLAATNNVTIKGGTNQVYRCLVAGALPVGALTVDTASCGTNQPTDYSATGLFVP